MRHASVLGRSQHGAVNQFLACRWRDDGQSNRHLRDLDGAVHRRNLPRPCATSMCQLHPCCCLIVPHAVLRAHIAQTASNFVDLVKSGFYNGLHFHRVIDGFMVSQAISLVEEPHGTRKGHDNGCCRVSLVCSRFCAGPVRLPLFARPDVAARWHGRSQQWGP